MSSVWTKEAKLCCGQSIDGTFERERKELKSEKHPGSCGGSVLAGGVLGVASISRDELELRGAWPAFEQDF